MTRVMRHTRRQRAASHGVRRRVGDEDNDKVSLEGSQPLEAIDQPAIAGFIEHGDYSHVFPICGCGGRVFVKRGVCE